MRYSHYPLPLSNKIAVNVTCTAMLVVKPTVVIVCSTEVIAKEKMLYRKFQCLKGCLVSFTTTTIKSQFSLGGLPRKHASAFDCT